MEWSAYRKYCSLSIVALLIFSLTAVGIRAQSGTTSIHGTVTDKSGASMSGANITLTNPEQALTRQMNSGPEGEYEFVALPPGTYTLKVEAAGFRKFEQTHLQLLVNSPATVNVKLDIGATSETVEVSAQAVALNTTDASIGSAFGENQVKQLPLEGRNVPDLLTLQAGVAYTGNRSDVNRDIDTRSGAVNGARSDQSNILLDGVDVNDQTRGYAFTSVLRMTPDAMQEFRVETTNYDAAGGRSSGAQVSIVTKGGSNNFHGSLYEFTRNTATSANDYFIKISQLQNGEPNKPPQLIRNIFGGSVGGRLKKDRAFFFVNYEGRRDAQANSELRVVPTATLRQGIVQYPYCTAALDDSGNCPGAVKNFSLSTGTLASMDPRHIGPNQDVLNFFQSFPLPN